MEPIQIYLFFPFLATLGASLAIIATQTISRRVQEQKQKIYAVNYMSDMSFRILSSTLTVKLKTIIPHIDATKRMMAGDDELLEKCLLADEFDILKSKAMSSSHLPNNYKVLIGYDDLELVQAFDTLIFSYESDENRLHLNEFVKKKLKSMKSFLSFDLNEKTDILNTYWDILDALDHESNRILFFVRYIILPRLKTYINSKQFFLFKTSAAKRRIIDIEQMIITNNDSFPKPDYLEKIKDGGIQRAL